MSPLPASPRGGTAAPPLCPMRKRSASPAVLVRRPCAPFLCAVLVRRRFNARRSPSLPRLAASPFLLLLSSPPFLSPPPPIPPCALAFLRQALRRPLLAKPPLCFGRQPVTRAQTTVYPPKNKEKRPLFKKKRENIWLFPEKCVPLHSLSRTGHLATRF